MAESDSLTDLYSLVSGQWALSDADLNSIGNKKVDASKKVHLSTGWYDSALLVPQVSITPVSGMENYADAGYGHVGERELLILVSGCR